MKRHTKKLVTGIALLVLGVLIFPVSFLGFVFLSLLTEKPLAQFLIPAEIEVSIQHEGKYYVWNDHHTTFEGKTYACSEEVPGNLDISLAEKENNQSIKFNSYLSISSQAGSASKSSVGYFDVDKPGVYTLKILGETPPRVFSFGQTVMNLKTFLVWIVVDFLAVIIAATGFVLLILGIVDFCKSRQKAKSEIQSIG